MVKLTVAVLAVALAGTASAGWRGLKLDGTSEASFGESMATFQKKLSPSRQYAFTLALQEIWLQGIKKANDEQRTYTTSEYLRQLDGLSYDEVVRIPDPTGKAEGRYRAQYYAGYRLENGVSPQSADRIGHRPLGHFPTTDPLPRVNGNGSRFIPKNAPNSWQQ